MKTELEPRWWREEPMMLTVGQVAWLLQVHPNTIYNMIHDGRLVATKIGRTWRIPRENVLCLSE